MHTVDRVGAALEHSADDGNTSEMENLNDTMAQA